MTSPLLLIENVSKNIGFQWILKKIELQLFSKEVLLLLGNNGAGKTTLLRLILGLSRPTQGTLFFNGTPYAQSLDGMRRHLGWLFQESQLYRELTVVENLKLFGTLYQLLHLTDKIDYALKKMELTSVAHRPVAALSSGMTRRAAIARFLISEPQLLILDEPYNALDPHSVEVLQLYLKEYQMAGGTILITTHQFNLGLEIATQVCFIKQKTLHHPVVTSIPTPTDCVQWLSNSPS